MTNTTSYPTSDREPSDRSPSTLTGAEVLEKLLPVDGAGSGLDADSLDGYGASAFSQTSHTHTGYQPLDADLTAIAGANNSTVLAATTASFLAADETKLDGIEALADVTDSENVWPVISSSFQQVSGSGTFNIDYSLGRYVDLTLTGDITTFTISNWPAAGSKGMLEVNVLNTGAYGISDWPTGSIAQDGTVPSIGGGSGVKSAFVMRTFDGGTTIFVDSVADNYTAI